MASILDRVDYQPAGPQTPIAPEQRNKTRVELYAATVRRHGKAFADRMFPDFAAEIGAPTLTP